METVLNTSRAVHEKERAAGVPIIRVLVVDDSVVMRQLITRMLSTDASIDVVASAKDGHDALAKLELLKPDLVTLDIEMPNLDGIGALRLIKQKYPRIRVIMCSSLTAKGATITIDALMLGADDYVTKQRSGEMTASAFDILRDELLAKIRHLCRLPTPVTPLRQALLTPPVQAGVGQALNPFKPRTAPRILGIGVSTGGPTALANLLALFPAAFPLPVVIVQHMPPHFTSALAERLSKVCKLPVYEAQAGMSVAPGQVLLAPGDFHLRLVSGPGGIRVTLDQGERESYCRPSVDVLFKSIAQVYGGAAIATVLTGMGSDGLAGVRILKNLGASVVVQDKESSVVWGMPGAIADAKLADAILPLNEIYPTIARLL